MHLKVIKYESISPAARSPMIKRYSNVEGIIASVKHLDHNLRAKKHDKRNTRGWYTCFMTRVVAFFYKHAV